MAKYSKRSKVRAPAQRPSGAEPRRLGNAAQSAPARSAGAARRTARRQPTRTSRYGWIAVGVVVVVIAVFVVIRVTSKSPSNSASGASDPAGRNPVAATASETQPVETVSASVYDSVGINAEPSPFVVTKGQPALGTAAKPRFVYVGAEYCPYCALMRWSIVAALSRFGTFGGLKDTTSASTDGNIPTFSFVGSTYTSKYLTFTSVEEADRSQNPLQPVPSNIDALYKKYDGNGTTPTKFSPGGTGIPFLDIGNKYVLSGDPSYLATLFSPGGQLQNGGPGRLAIAQAINDPSSPTGKAIEANAFIVTANYLSAAICNLNGGVPAAVCNSTGVKAAAKVLAAVKPIG